MPDNVSVPLPARVAPRRLLASQADATLCQPSAGCSLTLGLALMQSENMQRRHDVAYPRMLLARIREQDRWGCPGILSSIDLSRI